MIEIPTIKLYGSATCHKTNYYKSLLDEADFSYEFLDVIANDTHAEILRGLYANNRLNFPTITIGEKKLRNPSSFELFKWLKKSIPSKFP